MHPTPCKAKSFLLVLPVSLAALAALSAAGCSQMSPETSVAPAPAPAPKAPETKPEMKEVAPQAPEAQAPAPPAPAAKAPAPAAPSSGAAVGNKPGNRIPPFAATARTFSGDAIAEAALDSQKTDGVVVWMVSSSTCPYTIKYAPRVAELEKSYAAKGVRFVHVYPNRTESVESKRKFHKDKGFRGAWVEDQDAAIAKLLGAKKTPEIYLTAADGTIAYRGAIDDSGGDYVAAEKHYLTDALDAVLAGKPVEVRETEPAG